MLFLRDLCCVGLVFFTLLGGEEESLDGRREQSLTVMVQYLVKLPFPLTPQFKSMLQAGVGTRDLDVRWVSSISWYFLTLFGLQPVYNFILGSNQGTCFPFLMSSPHSSSSSHPTRLSPLNVEHARPSATNPFPSLPQPQPKPPPKWPK